MRVYVETNFVMEIARQQDQSADAEALLVIAEQGLVDLCIPSFCIAEPFAALDRYRNQRNDLRARLMDHLVANDLRRVQGHAQLLQDVGSIADRMAEVSVSETTRLRDMLRRTLAVARLLNLTESLFSKAIDIQADLGVSQMQDAIVLACVLADASSVGVRSLLVNPNKADFGVPEVRAALAAADCDYVSAFHAAVARLQSRQGESEV